MSDVDLRPGSRTPPICFCLLVGGLLVQIYFGVFSFSRNQRVQLTATLVWLAYMLGTPLILLFLKGARGWRWSVFILWLAYVALFGFAATHID